jgi:hypothetical protein
MASADLPGTWLTARRVFAHGLIVGVALWSIYAWNLATPGLRDRNGNLKGTDFLHFYALGSLAREHRGDALYNMDVQAAQAAERVPQAAGIGYLPLYPPQVSMLFAPLAQPSYAWALASWWLVCVLIYGACCYSIWRACPRLREYAGTAAVLAVSFPAFFHLIAWGQTSALALACFTLMFFALRRSHDFLAGIALGCLIFKPQLAVAAAIVLLASAAWKIMAAAALSAAAQLSAGVLYYGLQPLHDWLRVMEHLRSVLPALEPKPYQTYCLRTFWTMLIPSETLSSGLYLVSGLLVLALTVAVWKRATVPLSVRFSALLFATVLVAPHLTVYDLVVLAPALLLLSDWVIGAASTSALRGMGAALYLVYMLPLLGPLARWTHVQLSVVAMAIVVYQIWRYTSDTSPGSLHQTRQVL